MSTLSPKKSLGQHWLFDSGSLEAMSNAAEVQPDDTVLEVGPGLGTLTRVLLASGASVVAVEFDEALASRLSQNLHKVSSSGLTRGSSRNISATADAKLHWIPDQAGNDKTGRLTIINEDILKFDLMTLPKSYKVAANIPYYLTSNLIRRLLESSNPPSVMALLVQKEVAERIVAQPGNMSILAVATQFYAEVVLKELVPAELFTPPPKVDSQIIQIRRRGHPLFPDVDTKKFFQLVRAGFSEKRKKLRSSLSGGLHISKEQADQLLKNANIPADARAQELSLAQWHDLYLKADTTL